ncbi:Prolipoprotein diacylglyceryl transferase [Lentibacter algarum]|jgi:phosphatidylglycerol:prolipoprotein diacylglycerol transferase|uniref:Phosphatidylglycerol--prolipoprotein diacylglyceryl transferase n=1 Tax=Lentibacter algarum TaxID=576131 RepID=A0A1H3N8B5_9RHOB|nr:prolipoprotein diacylglyceryl transferase [Lentibacter algarum]SDY85181.1 Prolipoprotein diacylglyceryl transferase [Lentibacter algarum]
MNLAAIPFPDISPEIFSIEIGSLTFALRWYALAYIAGLLLGWQLCVRLIRNVEFWPDQTPPMTSQQLEQLLNWVVVGVILGGRLGFVLFYQPDYYLARPLEILKVWQGGMSFHGGFLGVSVAALVFALRNRLEILGLADLLALSAPIGLLLGRVANFINAELWGRPTTLPWGVVFPGEAAQSCTGAIGLCARHPSQIYEAALEGLVLGAVLLTLALRRKWLHSPGALTGMFLAGYGSARFLVEFVRQPDMQFVTEENPIGHALHFGTGGLTMGQILSLPMILTGVALIWWVRSDRANRKPKKHVEMG